MYARIVLGRTFLAIITFAKYFKFARVRIFGELRSANAFPVFEIIVKLIDTVEGVA